MQFFLSFYVHINVELFIRAFMHLCLVGVWFFTGWRKRICLRTFMFLVVCWYRWGLYQSKSIRSSTGIIRTYIIIRLISVKKIWSAPTDKYSYENRRKCIVFFETLRRNRTKFFRFKIWIHGILNLRIIFREKIDCVLNNEIPEWLDDLLIESLGAPEESLKNDVENASKTRKRRIWSQ